MPDIINICANVACLSWRVYKLYIMICLLHIICVMFFIICVFTDYSLHVSNILRYTPITVDQTAPFQTRKN